MSGDTLISILRRLIDPQDGSFTPGAAEAVLQFHFSELDRRRMEELADRSDQGALTTQEADEYDKYIEAGDFLALLKSKARLSLGQHSSAA